MKIKLKAILLYFPLTFLLLASCSNEPTLKLTDVSVDIITDEGVSGSQIIGKGENAVRLVPTVLYYQFTIDNTGSSRIGHLSKPLHLFIEHDSDLIPNPYNFGYSGSPVIPANESIEYKMSYGLGIDDTKGIIRSSIQPLPEQEKLDEIMSKALDAELVVLQLPNRSSLYERANPSFVENDDAEPKRLQRLIFLFDINAVKATMSFYIHMSSNCPRLPFGTPLKSLQQKTKTCKSWYH
ncbi:MAG: hypothetical protein APF76_09965 [Desulfitibacter sp. BRH_c19]|nr:MAG: hypothetical protein APF76_09965 [Desulfitibacter sp. BRH_c19]